jgi:carboxyl-terminal processing protease
MLINEHTKSAAEMIADFAGTNQLATLVGTRTAGEVLGAVNFLVGEGYRLRIPIGGWMTWNDRLLEGSGVSPTVEASPSIATLRAGQDVALQRAIELF